MSEDQKVHIIKTAGELFFRLGIRSVSIDDICRELGISKKTFYVYFDSKDELVAQLLDANLRYISGKMEEELVQIFLKRQEAEKNDVRRVPQLVYDLKKTSEALYVAVSSLLHCSQLRRTGYHQSSIAAKVGNLSAVRSRPSTCCRNQRHSSSVRCLYLVRCNANS